MSNRQDHKTNSLYHTIVKMLYMQKKRILKEEISHIPVIYIYAGLSEHEQIFHRNF